MELNSETFKFELEEEVIYQNKEKTILLGGVVLARFSSLTTCKKYYRLKDVKKLICEDELTSLDDFYTKKILTHDEGDLL